MKTIPKDKIKKILLIRPEMIGDTILLTPIISAIKTCFPNSSIYLLLKPGIEEIVKNNPGVSGWIFVKPFGQLLSEIKKMKFDISIVFEDNPTPLYAFLCLLAGIKNRIGDKNRLSYGWTYNKGVFINSANSNYHQVELYMELLKPLGIKKSQIPAKLHLDPEAEKIIDHLIPKSNKLFIGIHIGSGGGNKALAPRTYAQISDKLQERKDINVVLIGSNRELKTLDKIKLYAKKPFIDLVAKLQLQQLFSTIKRLDLFIGIDSGPMHIAATLNVPIVCIFTAKDVSPIRWFPWMVKNILIKSPKNSCSLKCVHKKCENDYCINAIESDDIVNAAYSILNNKCNNTLEETKKAALF